MKHFCDLKQDFSKDIYYASVLDKFRKSYFLLFYYKRNKCIKCYHICAQVENSMKLNVVIK